MLNELPMRSMWPAVVILRHPLPLASQVTTIDPCNCCKVIEVQHHCSHTSAKLVPYPAISASAWRVTFNSAAAGGSLAECRISGNLKPLPWDIPRWFPTQSSTICHNLSMSVELSSSNPECAAKAHHHIIIMKLQVPDFSQCAIDIWVTQQFWNQKVLDEIHDLGESPS